MTVHAEVIMLKTTALVVALGAAGAIALSLQMAAVKNSASEPTISPQEVHALAHLEGLPVQHFEDQSLIFPTLAKK
jgi:uncharacterized membrane protein YgdD (TMEM256/DUF423 family)